MNAEQAYLSAVDQFLATHDEWAADPDAPRQPSAEFEQSIMDMFEVCLNGDVPNRCRALNRYVEILAERWRAYSTEQEMDANGCPAGAFWQCVANIIGSRRQVEGNKPKLRESVKMLVDQKVPFAQIAGHIWGHRGDGPLCTNGQPDHQKIMQEYEKPNSVIPADWVHPEDKMLMEGGENMPSRRRVHYRDLKPARYTDEQVASLLRDGANIEQTSGVSGRSVDEVVAIAEANGIEAKHVDNLSAMRAPHEPTFDRDNTTLLGEATEGQYAPEAEVDVEQMILDLNDGSLGAPDIARMVSEQSGQNVSAQKVNAVLRKAKQTA